MNKELSLRKGTARHIEDELRDYHATKREIVRLQNGSQWGTAVATNRVLENLVHFVAAIEKVYELLPAEKQRFIELYYWSGAISSWKDLSAKIGIHHRTLSRWQKEIIFAVAHELGWR